MTCISGCLLEMTESGAKSAPSDLVATRQLPWAHPLNGYIPGRFRGGGTDVRQPNAPGDIGQGRDA